jgi:predicted alpha/beta hydrolase
VVASGSGVETYFKEHCVGLDDGQAACLAAAAADVKAHCCWAVSTRRSGCLQVGAEKGMCATASGMMCGNVAHTVTGWPCGRVSAKQLVGAHLPPEAAARRAEQTGCLGCGC